MVVTTSLNKIYINEELENVLSAEERSYYDRLHRNKKRQKEMYCGRLAAKKLVSKKFNYKGNLENIKLIKMDIKEKPRLFIENKKIDWDLSIAHNDDYAVVGVSSKGKIGIDIEKCNLELEKSFIKYSFCKEEIDCWGKFKCDDSNIWMLLWTVKEAIGKALGIGLSLGMDFVKILINENRNGLYFYMSFDEEITMKFKNMLYLTISYIPWIVYWTISAQLEPYGGVIALILELVLIGLQKAKKDYSFMDVTSVLYFIITIIGNYVLKTDTFIVGDGYIGYAWLFIMSIVSILIKKPFMRYYVKKDFSNELIDQDKIDKLSDFQMKVWAVVLFIDIWVFLFIDIPVVAVIASNVFVLIGIVLSIYSESK